MINCTFVFTDDEWGQPLRTKNLIKKDLGMMKK